MKTKNIYSYPINKEHVKEIVTEKSPAHRKYQSKDGTWFDLRNAIDFVCDVGTPVKAVLDGEVVHMVDNLKKNWDKLEPPSEDEMPIKEQDGNIVVIKHANNELSLYGHLSYKKVFVKSGQKVKKGEVIGLSGHTGWSIKPHLHFMVFRFLKSPPAKDLESLEIRWS